MKGARRTHSEDENLIRNFSLKKLMGRDYLRYKGVHERIILEQILQTWDARMWLRIWSSGGMVMKFGDP
jgi:hypothetical protein